MGWASTKLQSTREIVRVAVSEQGRSLRYAGDELKADRELVLLAVQEDGYALRFAARDLQADYAVALAAVSQDPCAIRWVAETTSGYSRLQEIAQRELRLSLDAIDPDEGCWTPTNLEMQCRYSA